MRSLPWLKELILVCVKAKDEGPLARLRSWEIVLSDATGDAHLVRLREGVASRALRLEELAGRVGLLPVPAAEPGSQIAEDDDRDWARQHGDLTVQHQAASRLFAAFEHLVDHSEGWRVCGGVPPFHVSPEFAVLRGALEATAAAWWILEPDSSSDRVLRALASKKKEAHYEAQATELRYGKQARVPEFRAQVSTILEGAADEVDSDSIPSFPAFSSLVDGFGGNDKYSLVGVCWRECSSYAHGFDWAAWRHRRGQAEALVPYVELAEIFIIACDALHTLWTQRWLPLASATPPGPLTTVFLPHWPPQPDDS